MVPLDVKVGDRILFGKWSGRAARWQLEVDDDRDGTALRRPDDCHGTVASKEAAAGLVTECYAFAAGEREGIEASTLRRGFAAHGVHQTPRRRHSTLWKP